MRETPQELYAEVIGESKFSRKERADWTYTVTFCLEKDEYCDARLEAIKLLMYLYHFAHGMKLNQIAKFYPSTRPGLLREKLKNLKKEGYVKNERNRWMLTDEGKRLVENLKEKENKEFIRVQNKIEEVYGWVRE